MRSPARNKFLVYYKMYTGETYIQDEYGNDTGSPVPQYGELKTAYLSISSNKGSSESDLFGTIEDYDRTMTTSDINCEINEDSILWLDGADTTKAHNFIVKKRAPWKHSISFAVKKLEVSNG